VSLSTVARELGRGGTAFVNRDYGHLGAVRHRANGVEYRAVPHEAILVTGCACWHSPRRETVSARASFVLATRKLLQHMGL